MLPVIIFAAFCFLISTVQHSHDKTASLYPTGKTCKKIHDTQTENYKHSFFYMAQVNIYISILQISLVCLIHPSLHFQYKPELPPKFFFLPWRNRSFLSGSRLAELPSQELSLAGKVPNSETTASLFPHQAKVKNKTSLLHVCHLFSPPLNLISRRQLLHTLFPLLTIWRTDSLFGNHCFELTGRPIFLKYK